MESGSRLIWMQLGRAEDGAVLNGDENPDRPAFTSTRPVPPPPWHL